MNGISSWAWKCVDKWNTIQDFGLNPCEWAYFRARKIMFVCCNICEWNICGALEHNVIVVNLFFMCYDHFSLISTHSIALRFKSNEKKRREKKICRCSEYFDSRKAFVIELKLQICHMLQPINQYKNWWTQTFYDIDLVAPLINQSNFDLKKRNILCGGALIVAFNLAVYFFG